MLCKQPILIWVLRTLVRGLVGVAIAGTMVACQATGPIKPTPPAALKLISSGALTVPDNCRADSSVIIAFTVYESGQTGDIQPAAGPACLQQALTAWVASFRYSPLPAQMPTSIATSVEWLLVEAKRGS